MEWNGMGRDGMGRDGTGRAVCILRWGGGYIYISYPLADRQGYIPGRPDPPHPTSTNIFSGCHGFPFGTGSETEAYPLMFSTPGCRVGPDFGNHDQHGLGREVRGGGIYIYILEPLWIYIYPAGRTPPLPTSTSSTAGLSWFLKLPQTRIGLGNAGD